LVWWKLRKAASAYVGLELLPDGLALACRRGGDSESPVAQVALLPCAPSERQAVLTDYVHQQNLQNALCNLVLSPGDYQLLLVEAPQVPEEELRAAIRWRLKDLVSTPLDSAIVDVCRLPSDATRSGKSMVFVTVSDREKMRKQLDLVEASGLKPSVIDIAELAMRNLTLLLPAEETESRGVVIVRIREGAGNLGLYRDGSLYLSRQFDLKYGAGLLDDLPADDLVLEIQRSLDYSERQMGQAPPSAIYICGDNVSDDKLTSSITQGLAVPVKLLQLHGLARISCDEDDAILQACVGSIGAALRHEEWS
jgi:MSHA biogenesis protein MshI